MQYFGVPRCPYCKKRVNLIRTWSLKRQGEYQCPRCGGISNIFLSPLIYVLALLAVFSGGAVYFFHKFVLDDVDLGTCFQVILPFALFFLVSLFLVYLEKPVIKRVPREENGKVSRAPVTAEDRRTAVSSHTGQAFVDQGDYLPPRNYRTGPVPQGLTHSQAQGGVPAQAPARPQRSAQAPVQRPVNNPVSRPTAQPSRNQGEASPAAQRRQAAQRVASQGSGAAAPQAGQVQRRVTAVQEGAPVPQRRTAPPLTPRQRPAQVVRPVDIPDVTEDFFKKYDDPAYVERRLKELEQGKKDR